MQNILKDFPFDFLLLIEKKVQQCNLRYYELHEINHVYLSSVAMQPIFSRSTKEGKER